MPMPRSFGSSQVTFLPLMKIWPAETSSSPAMQLSRVDLPQPEGPRSTMNSPSATSRVSFFKTSTAPKLSDRSRTRTLVIRSALHRARRDAAHEPPAGDEIDGERYGGRQDRRRHIDVV